MLISPMTIGCCSPSGERPKGSMGGILPMGETDLCVHGVHGKVELRYFNSGRLQDFCVSFVINRPISWRCEDLHLGGTAQYAVFGPSGHCRAFGMMDSVEGLQRYSRCIDGRLEGRKV